MVLEKIIDKLSIPRHSLQCRDKNCPSRLTHSHNIKIFHDSIIYCCLKASQYSIPHASKQCNSKVIAGWSEHVKPYREASICWHNAWKDCGSPRNAVIADVMRRSRSQYHRAVIADVMRRSRSQYHRAVIADVIQCYPTWLMK